MFSFVTPLNSTGYGVAGCGYAESLIEIDPTVQIKSIGNINVPLSTKLSTYVSSTKNFDTPSIAFWHLPHIRDVLSPFTGPKVGLTTFELEELSDKEVEIIKKLDMIGTPTKWGASILSRYVDIDKIFTAPHAFYLPPGNKPKFTYREIPNRIAHVNKLLAPIKVSDETLFLSACGKFESRKGYPELIQACIEHSKTRPIVLFGLMDNPFIPDHLPYSYFNYLGMYTEYTESRITVYKKGNFRLVLMSPISSREDMLVFLASCDYFIAPSKGEGFNLPLFEMMSHGMPCIASLNTGHLDYCNKNNVVPIETTVKIPAIDPPFFRGDCYWYNITKDLILDAIKIAERLSKTYRQELGRLSIESTSRYSWQESAKTLQTLMSRF